MKLCFAACALSVSVWAQIPQPAPIAPDTVVARIDGRDITAKEVSDSLRDMPPEFQTFYKQNPVYAVQQMYVMRHLAGLAENAKLGEDSPLKEQLAIARQNLLASAMLSHEQNSYIPPREAVRAHYEKNKANYQSAAVHAIKIGFKPQVGAAVASVSPEEQARLAVEAAMSKIQRPEAEARARAIEVVEKLKAGASVDALVAEYSDDAATRAKGGAMVIDHASSYTGETRKAVLALMPGDVSQPLRLPDGFLVVKLDEKSFEPLNKVELPIIQVLRSTHLNEWYASVIGRFTPQVQSEEFFRRASQPPAAPPPAPATPAQPGAPTASPAATGQPSAK